MHDGPVLLLYVGWRGGAGEDVVIQLRPAHADDAAKRAFQLVLQLQLLFLCRTAATTVDHDDGVRDAARLDEEVHRLRDAIQAATGQRACAGAEQRIRHGAVRVQHHSDLLCGVVCAGDILRPHQARLPQVDVVRTDVFPQRATVHQCEGQCSQVPDGCGCVHHADGCRVVNGGAQGSRIHEVLHVVAIPRHGLARVGPLRSRDPARPCRVQRDGKQHDAERSTPFHRVTSARCHACSISVMIVPSVALLSWVPSIAVCERLLIGWSFDAAV